MSFLESSSRLPSEDELSDKENSSSSESNTKKSRLSTIKPPRLRKKSEAKTWLLLFDSISEANNWTDSQRLAYALTSMPSDMSTWCLHKGYTTWKQFVPAFKEKYCKRVDLPRTVEKLWALQMEKRYAKLRDYVHRFEELKMRYERGIAERKLELAEKSPTSNSPSFVSEPVVTITEESFVGIFVRGLMPDSLRLYVSSAAPQDIEKAASIAKQAIHGHYHDHDTESENSSSDETERSRCKTNQQNKGVKLSSKTNKTTSDEYANSIEMLIKGVNRMTTAIDQLTEEQKNNKQGLGSAKSSQTSSMNSRVCYNCQAPGHVAADCSSPCKFCGGTHPHFKCDKYPKKPRASSSALLITSGGQQTNNSIEDMYAIKRKQNDESNVTTPPTQRIRVSDVKNNVEHQEKNKQVSHQLTKKSLEANDVVERPVFQVSLAQLADLSPQFRTQVKNSLTKHHNKMQANHQDMHMLNENQEDSISSERVPEGESAPHIWGKVNGISLRIILDGGCTSVIASLNLIKKLGIEEIDKVNRPLQLGDGHFATPVGRVPSLSISIGESQAKNFSALCLDVTSYDLLLGRHALHKLQVVTNWKYHRWSIYSSQGLLPLDVEYTAIPQKDIPMSFDENGNNIEVTSEEENENIQDMYVMVLASEVPQNKILCQDNLVNSRLSDLPERIESRTDLDQNIKNELKSLVQNYQHIFGTSYKHLTQTNLVTFHVDTGDAKPIYHRPNPRMSHAELDHLKEELKEMVKNGIIVPTRHDKQNAHLGGWSFPCRYVRKKNKELRLVTMFQELNKITSRDTWPLPNITSLIENLGKKETKVGSFLR